MTARAFLAVAEGQGLRRRRNLVVISLIVVALAVAGPALAQVIGRPVEGEFQEIYLINGRIVDKDGWPMNQLLVELTIRDLKGVTVKPLTVGTNCFGDFQGYFDIGQLDDKKATVTARVLTPDPAPDDFEEFSVSQPFDAFFRRTDFIMKAPFGWPSECQDARTYWPVRASVWGRVIDGREGHVINGTRTDAKPVPYWPVDMNVTLPDRSRHAPPEVIPTDVRGDFKYSFTFDAPMTDAEVTVGITAKHRGGAQDLGRDNVRMDVAYDSLARIAFAKVNVGDPEPRSLPFPPAAFALAVLGAVALALAPRRGRAA